MNEHYDYRRERPGLFTEEGQVMFLAVRDRAQELLKVAGAAQLGHMTSRIPGEGYQLIACVDRLVELGELFEISIPRVAGQHRVFVSGH